MLSQASSIASYFIYLALIICDFVNAETISTQKIHEDTINLSAKYFLENFSSQNLNERKAARLYLLGVLDATEGKSWCDYKTLKTISINEFLYEKMKKLPAKELDRRASIVIEELLHELAPCKES